MEQPQVKIAAVHEQVFFREPFPERFEVDLREHVDEINFSGDEELQQADAGAVVEEIVGLRIDRRLLGPIESGEERRKLRGGFDELIDRRGVQGTVSKALQRPCGQKRIDELR